ncbi:MAG TPA: hypothetical protein VFV07_13615, partial [Rhizomicrobium sp.]|nr:hypothetical protein [Rhizomicrobium sp.]
PVTLQILDAGGNVVRRFSSTDPAQAPKAERYFAKTWTRKPQALAAMPGMHRFVWDLRYARPDSAEYSYSIAAVWGHGTPIMPEGPFVLPGTYTVVLEASGQRRVATLSVAEDPRVTVSTADLAASLAMSQKVGAALSEVSDLYREQAALHKLLDARFPKARSNADPAIRALVDQLRAKPAPGNATFEGLAGSLAGVERALESVDAAPTDVQQQFFAETVSKLETAKREWTATKAGALAELNAALAAVGEKPIEITDADKRKIGEPDPGQDLP